MTPANTGPILKQSPEEFYSGSALQVAAAIRRRDYSGLTTALRQTPGIGSSRGSKDLPLLAWAMGHNDPESVRLLLEAGASADEYFFVGRKKMSLVSLAAGAQRPEFLDLLLGHKVNPNGVPGTEPPLFTAFYADKPERFERLLQAGADLNFPRQTGETVLIALALARDYVKALTLVKRGADPNVKMKNGTDIRGIIEEYPLPINTPQGKAQAELAAMLR